MKQITRHVLAIVARSRSQIHSSFRHFRTMKQIQVEAMTSMETIKPSTPTPQHLRRRNLSFFEQIEVSVYMNTIIYFSSDTFKTRSNVSNTLKTSLAEILKIYYPLAGRIADNNLYVDCRDQGVHYRETNIKGSLSEIISELDPSEMSKFLSFDHTDSISEVGRLPLLVVQANFFECGGLVIGLLMYHKVADGLSLYTFLKNWASVARRHDDKVQFTIPDFDLAGKFFPSVDLNGMKSINFEAINQDRRVSRRFVFSNDTLLSLCKKHEEFERRPSRIEALSTFIWKRYIASTQSVQPEKNYKMIVAVNLRPRFDPPLSPSAFGSIADMVIATDTSPNEDNRSDLIKSIRSSISNLSDPENIRFYHNGVELLPMINELCEWMKSENEVWIIFSSLCRIYQVRDMDFGWGPPSALHMCVDKICGRNIVVFMETADGDGVQAWISFNEEDMAKFEVDPEILAHATQP